MKKKVINKKKEAVTQKNPAARRFWISGGDGLQWQSLTYPLEPAMSLNVSLPPELENRVRQHVESGLYSSASEVIREALLSISVQ